MRVSGSGRGEGRGREGRVNMLFNVTFIRKDSAIITQVVRFVLKCLDRDQYRNFYILEQTIKAANINSHRF